MSVRLALPHTSPSSSAPRDGGTPLYLGGVLMVVILALVVWTGLF